MRFTGFGGSGGGCACCSGGTSYACSPCNLPGNNLTVSWTNVISGPGSITLTYTAGPPATWVSACVNGILFKVACTSGSIELRATYFTSGSCPTGTQQYCSNLRANPLSLTLSSYTCSPLSATFQCTGAKCTVLANAGYTSFTVTG